MSFTNFKMNNFFFLLIKKLSGYFEIDSIIVPLIIVLNAEVQISLLTFF